MTRGNVVHPSSGLDLRSSPASELRYPRSSVVIVAGIPGAGKTTLIRRLFGISTAERLPVRTADGVCILDSDQARNQCSRLFRGVPYRLWRPIVHLVHYLRTLRTLSLTEPPFVIHDTGTRFWVPTTVRLLSRVRGLQLHVILVDVPPSTASASQRDRNRVVRPRSFELHHRRWRERLEAGPLGLIAGADSATLVDRATGDHLHIVRFGSSSGPDARSTPAPRS